VFLARNIIALLGTLDEYDKRPLRHLVRQQETGAGGRFRRSRGGQAEEARIDKQFDKVEIIM